MSRDLMRVSAGDDDSDDDEERPMSRDELKAKTLRGMSKRCGPLSAMRPTPRFGSFLFTMFQGMALGLQQPKVRGGRTSRVGDSNMETLGCACCFAMCDGCAALPTSAAIIQ
jgi:hypothetical protein